MTTLQQVFLSSTNADLAGYRDAVAGALDRCDHLKCVDYRDWGPQPATAHDLCRERVSRADLFVGLLGPYRGWEVPSDNALRSITELEFEWALDAGKPRFICVTPDTFPVPAGIRERDEVFERQQAFRRRVMGDGAHVVSQDFASPDRLASSVINSVLSFLLARQLRQTATNRDLAESDDRLGVQAALSQLAVDKDADLDAMLENPTSIDGAELERRLSARAEALLKVQAEAGREAARYFRHIGALAYLRDTQRAIDAYRKSCELDPQDGDGWRRLGVLYIRKGEYNEARAALVEAKQSAIRSHDRALEARVSGNLGAIDFFKGDLVTASGHFEADHRLSREIGNKQGIARASGNLGLIYQKQSRHDEAEIMHGEALEMARELGNREEEARQIGNLAEVKLAQGDFDAAFRLHTDALALDEGLGNLEGQARHAGNLGEILARAGEMDKAEALFLRALAVDEKLANRYGQARHAGNLGRLYRRQQRRDIAKRHLYRAVRLYEEIEKPAEAAVNAAELAHLHLEEHRAGEARRWLETAIRLAPDHAGAEGASGWKAALRDLPADDSGRGS